MRQVVTLGWAALCGVLIAAPFLRAGLYPLVALGLVFPWVPPSPPNASPNQRRDGTSPWGAEELRR
jgi:hypothetical protein